MVLSKDGEIVDVDEFDLPHSLGEKAASGHFGAVKFYPTTAQGSGKLLPGQKQKCNKCLSER